MQGDGGGLEQCGLGKRKAVRQAIDDAGRNHNIFSEGPGTAVVRAGDSEDLAAVAKIDFSAPAGSATATIDGRIERDSVTCCKSPYSIAQGSNSSGTFVSHDNGRDATTG